MLKVIVTPTNSPHSFLISAGWSGGIGSLSSGRRLVRCLFLSVSMSLCLGVNVNKRQSHRHDACVTWRFSLQLPLLLHVLAFLSRHRLLHSTFVLKTHVEGLFPKKSTCVLFYGVNCCLNCHHRCCFVDNFPCHTCNAFSEPRSNCSPAEGLPVREPIFLGYQ